MKIYTKGGDGGETSLASGKRVRKHDLRVSLYGEADELNSSIGLALSFLAASSDLEGLRGELRDIQSLLFELASELADWQGLPEDGSVREEDIQLLEHAIDRMEASLPKLRSFILPGGHTAASALHLARTICRRLERSLVQAQSPTLHSKHHAEEVQSESPLEFRAEILKYINRLSDYLFTAARYVNVRNSVPDIEWHSRNRKK